MTLQTDVVIVGAGPCGIFQIFELGLLGIKAHIVDALPAPGGQCAELYPDKPIYDIPAIPVCNAQELVEKLMEQIKPFDAVFHLDSQVTELEVKDDDRFRIATSAGEEIETRAVVVAGGVGSFQPMPLRVAGIDSYVDSQVFYRVLDPSAHHDRDLLVLGGGDSAFDWAVELAPHAKSLTLVHRSDRFRAAPATVAKMRELESAGKLKFMIGNCVDFEAENGALERVHIRHTDESITKVDIDHALVFFGLSPKLGPIAEWGLDLNKSQIVTDTERFETNVPGVYAIGDIASYPGKKKLILSGFHEAALAAFAIKARLNPNEKVHLQYTTTSPIMHERLGVELPRN
ncbi:MAG: NAD(P)/FAD-dependent oxidoreductase [Gammaproteobacteria bacterium]|nr:NAD(P)/FAD-dependent oxidoreductase [Gammaproteobacteria bacterium]